MNSNKLGKKHIIISLIINIIVVLLTLIASIIMFTGFKFMYGYEPLLETTKIGMLKFFTVQSNLLMGIVSLLFAIKEVKLLKEKKDDIPLKMYIFKLMAATAVGLTFSVVFLYLGHIAKGGILSMLMNSNLFFHLIIPVISILNFIILEKTDKIKFKYTFCGLIPTFLYGIYYLTNVLLHIENGKVSTIYDWYWFVQGGVWTAVIVVPVIFILTYLISLIIWRCNKKKIK